MRMIALHPGRYGVRRVAAGEFFEVSAQNARVLRAIGKADYAPAEAAEAAPALALTRPTWNATTGMVAESPERRGRGRPRKTPAVEAPPLGVYQRRDLVSETPAPTAEGIVEETKE